MPEVGNNSTESRLSRFIEGCSQLQEIYAVAPLTYTNIMGEWWQRINDIIYTLGLTDTENNVVNIAWTVPVPGRKRSPFYEEELSTKTPEGVSVSESSRVSHVARSGTRDAATNARVNKAHKYGFIQSVDALFQRNVDTWGNVYEYFWNQTHDPATGDLLPSASIKEPADLTEMLFGRQGIGDEDITSLFEDATRNLAGDDRGLVNSMKHVIEDIIGGAFYDWLDDGLKVCNIESISKKYQLWKRTNGTWARINASTEYTYRGKTNVDYILPAPVYNGSQMHFSKTLTANTMLYASNPSSTVSIATVYNNASIDTTEKAIKQEFINFAISGRGSIPSPLSKIAPSPSANDIAYVAVKMLVNEDTNPEDDIDNEYGITKNALFVYNGTAWTIIEDTYGTFIPGVYENTGFAAPTPANATERAIVKTCLIEIKHPTLDLTDHSPSSLMELLFGTDAEDSLCELWKSVSTGSLIKESMLVKDAIGHDLLDLVTGDPICVSTDGSSKSGPHSIKEMLFGSLTVDEMCNSFKQLNGDSILQEIHNITNYLGDSYQEYLDSSTYHIQSVKSDPPVDPTTNPMTIMGQMDRGQVLYGDGISQKLQKRTYRADYVVEAHGYVCDTTTETTDCINVLISQGRGSAAPEVYDLQTNRVWKYNSNSNSYAIVTGTLGNATNEIYKKYGAGKIISNDVLEKIFYTRGDINKVEELVDKTIIDHLTVKKNTSIGGNLSVSGNETVSGTLSSTGKITGGNGLEITGNTKTTTLTVTSNGTIGGTLGVTGKLTGTGTAEFSGGNSSTPSLKVTGNTVVSGDTKTGTLHVDSDAAIGRDLSVARNETISGNLTVLGSFNKQTSSGTQEYVTYITNQSSARQQIATNLIDKTRGLNLYSNKIGINAGPGLKFMNDGSSDVKKLYVNFSEFVNSDNPEIRAAFNDLLEALHLQRYVGENGIGSYFYVNPNHSNAADDIDHGTSESSPWKTIQYATECLAKNYNINNRTVYLHLKGGTYENWKNNDNHWVGEISLPLLQRTTGRVVIRPYLNSNDKPETVNINFTTDYSTSIFTHTGGVWELQYLNMKLTLTTQRSGSPSFPHFVSTTDSTGQLVVRNCNMSFVDNSRATDDSHGRMNLRCIYVSGRLHMCNNSGLSDDTTAGRKSTWSGTKGNAYVTWFYIENNGLVEMGRPGYDLMRSEVAVSGKFDVFCRVLYNGQYRLTGVGENPIWTYSNIGADSQGYHAVSGGTIITGEPNIAARESYFPHNPNKNNYFAESEGSWVSPGAGIEG